MKRKLQGEIFGLALLFVVILLGFLLYTQFKDDRIFDEKKDETYKTLADSTLNTLLKTSTGCYITRSSDILDDVINQCIRDFQLYSSEPEYSCEFSTTKQNICAHSKKIINQTLFQLYNSTNFSLGPTPFEFYITMETAPNDIPFKEESYTNFDSVTYRDNIITKANYRQFNYKRVSSKPITFSTIAGNIEFELLLYYR